MGILDLLKEVPLSAVLREKIVGLESENKFLKEENSLLKIKLQESEDKRRALEQQIEQKFIKTHNSNPDGYVCDYCGSLNLRRTGSRPDPTFGVLGIKRKIFVCDDCGKESSFVPSQKERNA